MLRKAVARPRDPKRGRQLPPMGVDELNSVSNSSPTGRSSYAVGCAEAAGRMGLIAVSRSVESATR